MQLPKDSLFHTVTKRFYFGESLHAVTKRFYLWWIYLCSHQKILSLVNLYNHAVAKRFYAGESTHAVTWGFYHCVSSEWYRLSSQFEVGHKKLDSGSCTSLNNISLVHILFFCSKEENNVSQVLVILYWRTQEKEFETILEKQFGIGNHIEFYVISFLDASEIILTNIISLTFFGTTTLSRQEHLS